MSTFTRGFISVAQGAPKTRFRNPPWEPASGDRHKAPGERTREPGVQPAGSVLANPGWGPRGEALVDTPPNVSQNFRAIRTRPGGWGHAPHTPPQLRLRRPELSRADGGAAQSHHLRPHGRRRPAPR